MIKTLKINVLETFIQKRNIPHPHYFVGEGKIKEIKDFIRDHEIDSVLFNGVLKPSQHYNLESLLEVQCIDRIGIILRIFTERARTREAKLQVELARLQYEAPFLREWIHIGKEGEHPGFLAGGEYRVDIYYNFVKKRINKIKQELESTRKVRNIRRNQRKEIGYINVVLVGYTNVGKSSLFNILTESEVFVDEMMFSTLSTTTRRVPEQKDLIVITDTIGFIEGMPPWLIESFKATLEEIQEADLIIWIFDGSESMNMIRRKYDVCAKAIDLKEKCQIIPVINKLDLMRDDSISKVTEEIKHLIGEEPILVSAKRSFGINKIVNKIMKTIKPHVEVRLEFVNSKEMQKSVSIMFEKALVKSISYENRIKVVLTGSKKDIDIILSICKKYIRKIKYIMQ